MKTSILTALALAGLTLFGYGQGQITVDSSEDPGGGVGPLGQVFIGGVLDTGTDINLQLVEIGPTAQTLVTFLLSQASGDTSATVPFGATEPASGDITGEANGTILDPNGNVYSDPTEGAATVVTLQMYGWLGGDSYAAATGPKGISGTFTEALSSGPILANTANMPNLNLITVPVPEPATFALAGLGIASLLAFRRRS